MERLALAAVVNRAADYIDSHGLKSGSWGTAGGPVCMNAALAIALHRDPAALGRWWFLTPGTNPTLREVGAVVLESGLLDQLPVPDAVPGATRRRRPAVLDARRAVIELAAWSDAPGRTAAGAAAALRAQAALLLKSAACVWSTSGSDADARSAGQTSTRTPVGRRLQGAPGGA